MDDLTALVHRARNDLMDAARFAPKTEGPLAAIRRHCDAKGIKGKDRAKVIRECKRLVMERLGVHL